MVYGLVKGGYMVSVSLLLFFISILKISVYIFTLYIVAKWRKKNLLTHHSFAHPSMVTWFKVCIFNQKNTHVSHHNNLMYP